MSKTESTPLAFLDTEAGRKGLADMWAVYEANLDVITEATRVAVDPDHKLQEMASRAGEAADQAESRARLRAALLQSDWEPYLANIRRTGAGYARAGMDFSLWFSVFRAFRGAMRQLLINAHEHEPTRLANTFGALGDFAELTLEAITNEYMKEREATISKQQVAIAELSTPVLPVREGLLVLPIIGVLDSTRARQLTEQLLEAIRFHRALAVVIDVTGVPAVDSAVANHLLQTVQATRLLGARAFVTGLSTANAQTLVRIGVSLSGLDTAGDLRDGIELAEAILARRKPN